RTSWKSGVEAADEASTGLCSRRTPLGLAAAPSGTGRCRQRAPPPGPTGGRFGPDERRCRMGVLDRFERGIEKAVNGAFARAFKSEVQPVEIASALRRAMDD